MKKKTDPLYQKVLDLTGRDAILARGMVEAFDQEGMTKLRDCQTHAGKLANEYGAFIDMEKANRTSQVGKMLRDAGIFLPFQQKTTKGYVLEEGPMLDDFCGFLEDKDNYGRTPDKNPEPLKERMELLDYLKEYGHIRANQATNKIPPKVYQVLGAKASLGELDVIYVPKGALVKTRHNGEAVTVEYYVD